MKFAFVTCVQLGLSCIEKIYKINGKLDLLITLHDYKAKKKSGRIYLDEFAKSNNIMLTKINHINDQEVTEAIKQYDIDWLFIIGWSQIANSSIINAPKRGCIGMHPTLLPKGRGRAAIPWAILKGLDKTGVTMFKLDEGVDTGPILGQEVIPLSPLETAASLYKKVNVAHEDLIEKIFPLLETNQFQLAKQIESEATYWEGRTPSDGEIQTYMSIDQVDKLVRATTHPYPGAFFKTEKGIIRIWSGNSVKKGETTEDDTLIIELADGIFVPKDYEVEYNN